MNLKDYYTETETTEIIGANSKTRRPMLNAVKIFNRWYYPRSTVNQYQVHKKEYEPIDLEVSQWTNLSGVSEYWPYSRERLYQLSIRLDEPRIQYTKINKQTLFNINSIKSYMS